MVLEESLVPLSLLEVKGLVNGDEVTTSVKSSFCFQIVKENVCFPYCIKKKHC